MIDGTDGTYFVSWESMANLLKSLERLFPHILREDSENWTSILKHTALLRHLVCDSMNVVPVGASNIRNSFHGLGHVGLTISWVEDPESPRSNQGKLLPSGVDRGDLVLKPVIGVVSRPSTSQMFQVPLRSTGQLHTLPVEWKERNATRSLHGIYLESDRDGVLIQKFYSDSKITAALFIPLSRSSFSLPRECNHWRDYWVELSLLVQDRYLWNVMYIWSVIGSGFASFFRICSGSKWTICLHSLLTSLHTCQDYILWVFYGCE